MFGRKPDFETQMGMASLSAQSERAKDAMPQPLTPVFLGIESKDSGRFAPGMLPIGGQASVMVKLADFMVRFRRKLACKSIDLPQDVLRTAREGWFAAASAKIDAPGGSSRPLP